MAKKLPKLCRHKASNRAYATDPYTGREHFFGIWGTPEAQRAYDEWIRRLLDRRREVASGATAGSSITVSLLITDFMAHARSYYRKGGKETSEVDTLAQALTPVNELYGTLAANNFGPDQLKSVRQWMIDREWSRGNINHQIQRVRRVWRWGVEHQLVRPETLAALESVPGLRKGRSAAKESEPVEPVSLEVLEATLPRLDPVVRAMVEIQLHADMRPGEVVIMRPMDIDRREQTWLYVPHTHKTEHHGQQRRIFLGPKVRVLLAPFLLRCPREDSWLFPSRARGRHAAKRTHWTVSGFRKAIQDACKISPPLPPWHPVQLRHTMATEIRKRYGLEAAQVVLGHAEANVTQIYAQRDEALARRVAEDIG